MNQEEKRLQIAEAEHALGYALCDEIDKLYDGGMSLSIIDRALETFMVEWKQFYKANPAPRIHTDQGALDNIEKEMIAAFGNIVDRMACSKAVHKGGDVTCSDGTEEFKKEAEKIIASLKQGKVINPGDRVLIIAKEL